MSDFEIVKAVLLDSVQFPSDNLSQSERKALVEGLPPVLLDNGMLAIQKDVAALINETLSGAKTAAETKALTTAHAVREIEVQITAAQEAQEAATRSKEKASDEAEARTEACNSARVEHIEAEKFEHCLVQQLQELKDEKKKVHALLTSMQKFDNSDGMEALDNEGLLQYFAHAKAESTLLSALPSAIQILPSTRGSYDSLTWAEARKILERAAAKLDTELGPMEMEARYATSEALGLWAIYDSENSQMAEANLKFYESIGTLLAAETELKRQQANMSEVSLWLASNKKKVQELNEAHAAFERLHCSPVPALPLISPRKEVDVVHLTPQQVATLAG